MAQILFDLTLLASIRVEASSIDEARDILRRSIDANTANLGAFPDGSPILCEVSIEGDIDLGDDGDNPFHPESPEGRAWEREING